jgi:hypothetical protein
MHPSLLQYSITHYSNLYTLGKVIERNRNR